MYEDPTDPGHFLVGRPLLSVTEPEIKENARHSDEGPGGAKRGELATK